MRRAVDDDPAGEFFRVMGKFLPLGDIEGEYVASGAVKELWHRGGEGRGCGCLASAEMEREGMIGRILGGFLVVASAVWISHAHAQSADQCKVPPAMTRADFDLPRTAAILTRPGAPLTIVALGSSSTEGVGASAPRFTYPSQLQGDLTERLSRPVSVLNKGIGGEIASQMLTRMDRDVMANHPDLVIWQAGTNDYLAHVPAEEMAKVMKVGISQIRAAGIDLLMLEPQYLPKDKSDTYKLYLDTFREVAASEHVADFHRFDIMKYWLTSNEFDASQMMSADSLHMRDGSYICLASLIADTIESAARIEPARIVAKQNTSR